MVDLGFGNPDIPSPDIAVDKLAEAAHNPRNHRYSASRGIPKLRQAAADLYRRRFGVILDPDTEVISTIGAKEGFSHLMWVLLQPGDAALVPSPSYPIHIWGPYFAGADARQVPIGAGEDYIANVMHAYDLGWPKPRVVVLSFPHNPTTATVELADLQRLVDWAREREVILVHDFAYAETAFDGWLPPSILQCEGAKDVAVELYSMTKSFSMAGWRVAFLAGNRRSWGPRQAQELSRLRHLPAGADRGDVTLNEAMDYPLEVNAIYASRRNALCDGLDRIGWDIPPARHDVRLGADPGGLRRAGLDRVRQAGHQRVRRRGRPGRRLRSQRRRLRAVRADRERAADRPGRPRDQERGRMKVVVLRGDGIGPEITTQALRALTALAPDVELEEHLFGARAIRATGTPLPDETLAACLAADAVLKGPIGDPEFDAADVRPSKGCSGCARSSASTRTFGRRAPTGSTS